MSQPGCLTSSKSCLGFFRPDIMAKVELAVFSPFLRCRRSLSFVSRAAGLGSLSRILSY